jgi:phage N-6-adenine-methyltransferase
MNDEYGTPWFFYQALDRIFSFTVDACASPLNAKHKRYWTVKEDGLAQPWMDERVFFNPPYSDPAPWVKKAHEETLSGGCPVAVGLVRLDPGAAWFRWTRSGIRWDIPYRMRFWDSAKDRPMGSYGFPCCVVIWMALPIVPPWQERKSRGGGKGWGTSRTRKQ